jgi:hypothetical protein
VEPSGPVQACNGIALLKRGSVCCASVQNAKLRSQLLTYFNTNLYSTFYDIYVVGLKMTILGRNM